MTGRQGCYQEAKQGDYPRGSNVEAYNSAPTGYDTLWLGSKTSTKKAIIAVNRALRTTTDMDNHRAAMATLAQERAACIREAVAEGMSQSEIARVIGVTPKAISKLLMRTKP